MEYHFVLFYINLVILFFTVDESYCMKSKSKKYSNMYHVKDQVLGLKEEADIEKVVEDNAFTGGSGVKSWIKLFSGPNLYLLGLKAKGLSLITVSKISSNSFHSVEKQIDIGLNVSSAVMLNNFNSVHQRHETIVIVATESPNYEVRWYRISNFKLVLLWSWPRFSGTKHMLHFKVYNEHRLLLLDTNGLVTHLYTFSLVSSVPNIREIEVLPLRGETTSIHLSESLTQPLLYTLTKDGNINIYRYKLFCPDSLVGGFVLDNSLYGHEATSLATFVNEETTEYLAVGGRFGGIFQIDALGRIVQDMKLENVDEWLILKAGPDKQKTLILGKTSLGDILLLTASIHGWKSLELPSCYKHGEDDLTSGLLGDQLACFKNRPWAGAVSLDLGDQPTVIFGQRKFYGEMYHVIVKMHIEIMWVQELEDNTLDYWTAMKTGLEGLMSAMTTRSASLDSCSIQDTLWTIDSLVSRISLQLDKQCPRKDNTSLSKKQISSNLKTKPEVETVLLNNKEITNDVEKFVPSDESVEGLNTNLWYHPISPDMDPRLDKLKDSNDVDDDFKIAGIPKISIY